MELERRAIDGVIVVEEPPPPPPPAGIKAFFRIILRTLRNRSLSMNWDVDTTRIAVPPNRQFRKLCLIK